MSPPSPAQARRDRAIRARPHPVPCMDRTSLHLHLHLRMARSRSPSPPCARPAEGWTSMAFAAGGIDVWLTRYDAIDDEDLLDSMRRILDEEERAHEHVFYFADDRRRYLVTRALVRTVLSHYLPLPPEAWMFTRNAYGRPAIAEAIAEAWPEARGIAFNLSHTRGLIALAIGRGRELGVDVEHLSVRHVSLGIAHRFFSPLEVRDLARLPDHAQQDRFFEYWTFKESYIKARGMGLSLPLDGFSFEFPHPEAVRIRIDPALQDRDERWHFWQFRPSPEYLMALCAERSDDPPPAITLRTCVPLAGACDVTMPLLRRSQPA